MGVRAEMSASQGDSSSWAFRALASVLGDFVEDDYDCMADAYVSASKCKATTPDSGDEPGREDWQYNLGKINCLKIYASASEYIRPETKECHCVFSFFFLP